jgi:hypothetical protein
VARPAAVTTRRRRPRVAIQRAPAVPLLAWGLPHQLPSLD